MPPQPPQTREPFSETYIVDCGHKAEKVLLALILLFHVTFHSYFDLIVYLAVVLLNAACWPPSFTHCLHAGVGQSVSQSTNCSVLDTK